MNEVEIIALTQKLRELEALDTEYMGTIEALKELEEEFMTTLGSGVLVKAKVDKVLVDVGNGVFMEKEPEKIVEMIERRREEVKRTIARIKELLRERNVGKAERSSEKKA